MQTETPKRLTKAQLKAQEREAAIAKLHELLKPGDTILTVLRHVSDSGLTRRIDFFTIPTPAAGERSELLYLSGWIAAVLGYGIHARGGIIAGGVGMDAGFHIVHSLGMAMWPKGTTEPHGQRNGKPDSDGGYALKHQWI